MAVPSSVHYAFEDLGDGVHAGIARLEGDAVCNSGVVDLDGGGLVFDTGLTPHSARDLRAGALKLLGRAPSVAANSHWHLDHSLGNQEFSTVPIWATRRTREILLERRSQFAAELEREQLEKDLRELESHRGEMRSEEARMDFAFISQISRALLAAAGHLTVVPPDQTFETRLALPGRRGAELLSFGSGHTEADAVLFLPKEKVLFAGDLVVVGVQPSMGSSDPEHWLVVLDEIGRLEVEHLVPGHGPVTKLDGIGETRRYISATLEAASRSDTAPLPGALRRWEGSLSLAENLRFVRGWVAARR